MINLDTIESGDNLTPEFTTDKERNKLLNIAHNVIKGYKIDCDSRREWETTIDKAMDIAKQIMEQKNFPWPKAANVKLPLIAEATINFAATVIPEILPNDKIVQFCIRGKDRNFFKLQRGERVADYMSYQLLDSPDWSKGVRSLLHILPVVGTVFKKTYYCEPEKRTISEVCSPKDVVVNYTTKSLATARRITHKITLSINDIVERQRRGLFNEDVLIDDLRPNQGLDVDDDFDVELLEQYCWLDLDEDGYNEPYVITVHEKSLKILCLRACIDSIEKKNGKVVKITQYQYFTDYHFIFSPDGGYYSLGFGHLLLPINKACNAIVNQSLNAGMLAVSQGGFLAKGLRMRDSDYRFKPYEYKVVDVAPGNKLADSVYQFPVREPSAVLMNLLEFLVGMSDRITKSSKAMSGDISGSNVSKDTMGQMIAQGSKIFSMIYSSILDSMSEEYSKIYKMNYYYLSNKEYRNILDDELADVKKDFELESNDVRPIADPIYSSMEQRLSKITVLMNLRTADPRVIDMYILQTLKFDDEQIKMLLPPPDPNAQPPAKDQKELAQARLAQSQSKVAELQALLMTQQGPLDLQKAQKEIDFIEAQTVESASRAGKSQQDAVHNKEKNIITATKMQQQETRNNLKQQHDQHMDVLNYAQKDKAMELKAAEVGAKLTIENKKVVAEKDSANNRSE